MHPKCDEPGCGRDENRDGKCLLHKLKTVSTDVGTFRRERNGGGPAGTEGSAAYARSVYEKARANGIEPEPMNKESARFAPRRKVTEGGVI